MGLTEAAIDAAAARPALTGAHIIVVGDLSKVRDEVVAAVAAAAGAAPTVTELDALGQPVGR